MCCCRDLGGVDFLELFDDGEDAIGDLGFVQKSLVGFGREEAGEREGPIKRFMEVQDRSCQASIPFFLTLNVPLAEVCSSPKPPVSVIQHNGIDFPKSVFVVSF